jgi:hypothetical protein
MFPQRSLRSAGLALVLVLGACNTEGNLFAPDRIPGQSGGDTSSPAVVGEWETILIISTDGDLQNWTTNWIFRLDLTCRFQQTVESLVEGFPRIELRPCTWSTANGILTVVFTDNGEVLPMTYEFAGLNPNRLVLDDIEYVRIP